MGGLDAADIRFATLRMLWGVSPNKSERGCRRWARPHQEADGVHPASTVAVLTSPHEAGGVAVGIGGLQVCGSWHCPVDGSKIAMVRAAEEAHGMRLWAAAAEFDDLTIPLGPQRRRKQADGTVKILPPREISAGGALVLGTFSARHHLGHRLDELVTAMRRASTAMSSGRAAQEFRDRTGLVLQVRVFECNHGDEFGWHPHFHYLLFFDRPWTEIRPDGLTVEAAVADSMMPLWDLWAASLAADGFDAVAQVWNPQTHRMESAGFDARLVDLSSPEDVVLVAGYVNKGQTTSRTAKWATPGTLLSDASGSAARELVGGVWKAGKAPAPLDKGRRHRSIAQVTEDLAVDRDPADVAIVVEFKATMARLRMPQRKPTPGMRAALVVLAQRLADRGVFVPGTLWEPELSDEEIAAQPEIPDAEVQGHVNVKAWATWLAWEMPALRAAGRIGGVAGVLAFLDARNTNDGDGEPLGFVALGPPRERDHADDQL